MAIHQIYFDQRTVLGNACVIIEGVRGLSLVAQLVEQGVEFAGFHMVSFHGWIELDYNTRKTGHGPASMRACVR